jgi:chromosome segregation ATPase
MRNQIANPVSDRNEKLLRFPHAPRSAATTERETALDLVNQAARVIMSIEAQATEVEVRARNLVRDAGEKLQLAESRIQSLEAARRTAEQGIHEANARAQELEEALKEAQSRAAAGEAELYAMERRVKAAETRANETKETLISVEDAIRTKLLDLRRTAFNNRTAAG